MNTWHRVRISDLGKIVTGKTPKTAIRENYGGKVPFLTPSDDMTVKYVRYTNKSLTEQGVQEVKNALLPPNSVCVSCIGSDLGKVVITTEHTVTNQQINSIVVDEERYDVSFIYYAMLILGKELNFISKTSTAVPIVNKSSFSSYEIKCPPLEMQKKIASILSAFDAKIECNQRINDNLQQQALALFRAWFVNYVPFNGIIPTDWHYVSFSEILSSRNEKSSDPFLPMYSVTDTGIYPRDEKFKKNLSMTNAKSKIVYQTDLVFGMSREILNWGVMRFPIGGVSSAYNVFAVSEKINSFYLESYMKANIQYFKDLIRPASREGQSIDKNVLMQKEILIPTDEVLCDYYNKEEIFTRLIHHNSEEITRLTMLRNTLLPKLMSGEIDVSDI